MAWNSLHLIPLQAVLIEIFGDGLDPSVDDGMGTSPALSPLSHQILKAVVDEHELTIGKDGPEFRLMKRHNAA